MSQNKKQGTHCPLKEYIFAAEKSCLKGKTVYNKAELLITKLLPIGKNLNINCLIFTALNNESNGTDSVRRACQRLRKTIGYGENTFLYKKKLLNLH